jgi:thiol-disulfide isomerase/thioredoxin
MEEDVVTRSARSGAVLAVAMLVLSLACGRDAVVPPATVDTPALQARLRALQGRPTLLVFWATWCKPCVAEIPDLVALHREAPSGLQIIAVSLDEFLSGEGTMAVVAEFLRNRPLPYEQLVYTGSQDALLIPFDLSGSIPYAILYDAGGNPLRRFEGQTAAAEIRAALAAAPGAD